MILRMRLIITVDFLALAGFADHSHRCFRALGLFLVAETEPGVHQRDVAVPSGKVSRLLFLYRVSDNTLFPYSLDTNELNTGTWRCTIVGKGGFSWKRATGISRTKSKVSRALGVPLTRSGRQRKIGAMTGCLIPSLLILMSVTILVHFL